MSDNLAGICRHSTSEAWAMYDIVQVENAESYRKFGPSAVGRVEILRYGALSHAVLAKRGIRYPAGFWYRVVCTIQKSHFGTHLWYPDQEAGYVLDSKFLSETGNNPAAYPLAFRLPTGEVFIPTSYPDERRRGTLTVAVNKPSPRP
ncbi:hypothetical protein [Stappia phage SI01]|uniref:Uncharacterized protein n=1 Tax=Stappia phage SI01 TaxID=2847766 RepID=A0AAE7SN74_9CAUD|nr:hypothetical protein [Stappia phage SI01]